MVSTMELGVVQFAPEQVRRIADELVFFIATSNCLTHNSPVCSKIYMRKIRRIFPIKLRNF